jgi:hypothetical protein
MLVATPVMLGYVARAGDLDDDMAGVWAVA